MRIPVVFGAASLALMVAAPAPAAASWLASDSFVDAKSGYRVEVSHDGADMLLDGFNPASHQRFHLKVARGVVSGVFAGQPINYVMTPGTRDAELASNTVR